MSNEIFIDTLYIVAMVNERDAYHEQASGLSLTLDGRQLITTEAVIIEIGNALARNFKAQAIRIIDEMLSSQDIEVVPFTRSLFDQAYSIYQDYDDKKWGLVDCMSFAVMRQRNITGALTFDQHFVQAGFQALMR